MSHLVSPTGFRSGKTSLWRQSELLASTNKQLVISPKLSTSQGLEKSLDLLLKRYNLYVISSSTKLNSLTGSLRIKALYYPLFFAFSTKHGHPLYTSQLKLVNNVVYNKDKSKQALSKLWLLKQSEFNNRFVSTKQKKNSNKFLSELMFKGARSNSMTKTINLKHQELIWFNSMHSTFWYKANKLFNNNDISLLLSKKTWNQSKCWDG